MGDVRQQSASEKIPFSQIAETANDIIIVTTPDLAPPGPVITYVNAKPSPGLPAIAPPRQLD
jgi:hypothetical protein